MLQLCRLCAVLTEHGPWTSRHGRQARQRMGTVGVCLPSKHSTVLSVKFQSQDATII